MIYYLRYCFGISKRIKALLIIFFCICLNLIKMSASYLKNTWYRSLDLTIPTIHKGILILIKIYFIVRKILKNIHLVLGLIIFGRTIIGSRSMLMFPWLMIYMVRIIGSDLISFIIGIYKCMTYNPTKGACLKCLIGNLITCISSMYIWFTGLRFYTDLKRRESESIFKRYLEKLNTEISPYSQINKKSCRSTPDSIIFKADVLKSLNEQDLEKFLSFEKQFYLGKTENAKKFENIRMKISKMSPQNLSLHSSLMYVSPKNNRTGNVSSKSKSEVKIKHSPTIPVELVENDRHYPSNLKNTSTNAGKIKPVAHDIYNDFESTNNKQNTVLVELEKQKNPFMQRNCSATSTPNLANESDDENDKIISLSKAPSCSDSIYRDHLNSEETVTDTEVSVINTYSKRRKTWSKCPPPPEEIFRNFLYPPKYIPPNKRRKAVQSKYYFDKLC